MTSLLRGEIESVTLDQPDIDLYEKQLASLINQGSEGRTTGGAGLPFGLKIHKLDIEKANLSYEEKNGATADIIVSYHASDIALSQSGQLSTGDQELLIEEGEINHKKIDDAPFALQRLHMKGRVREGFIELDHLTCDGPTLHLRPELISLFFPKTSSSQNPATGPATGEATALPVKGIRARSLALRNFAVDVHGFGKDNASSLTLPEAAGNISYEAEQFEWLFDGEPTASKQTLRIGLLDVHPPTGDSHVRCKDARMKLDRTGKGLQWRIEQLDLDGLDVNWTSELRSWLMPPVVVTTPTATPPTESVASKWSKPASRAQGRSAR